MFKFLELSKVYLLEESTEVTYEQLNTIITAPFSSSKYQTYGNFISAEPPTFLLMNKWFRKINAQIIVTLEEKEKQTKLFVVTKTNPVLVLIFFLAIISLGIQPITLNRGFDLKYLLSFVIVSAFFWGIDRFSKTQLYASLENDLKTVRRNWQKNSQKN